MTLDFKKNNLNLIDLISSFYAHHISVYTKRKVNTGPAPRLPHEVKLKKLNTGYDLYEASSYLGQSNPELLAAVYKNRIRNPLTRRRSLNNKEAFTHKLPLYFQAPTYVRFIKQFYKHFLRTYNKKGVLENYYSPTKTGHHSNVLKLSEFNALWLSNNLISCSVLEHTGNKDSAIGPPPVDFSSFSLRSSSLKPIKSLGSLEEDFLDAINYTNKRSSVYFEKPKARWYIERRYLIKFIGWKRLYQYKNFFKTASPRQELGRRIRFEKMLINRLDVFVIRIFGLSTLSQSKKLIRLGHVYVNGIKVKSPKRVLVTNELITLSSIAAR